MDTLENYLSKSALFHNQIKQNPDKDLKIIVVIPCYNEDNLIESLNSLKNCSQPDCSIEIIVVINSSEADSVEIIEKNLNTFNLALKWVELNSDQNKKFFILNYTNLRKKDAGVGLARKIGMDIAVERFNYIHNYRGIILCYDADCTCQQNYLTEIFNHFDNNTEVNAAAINFEHPIDGADYTEDIYNGIIQYELYLRYYMLALRYTGFPYSYHTIGSSFAVRADIYAKQGGMNKRKAGEDFYFLQKVIPLGNFSEIYSTTNFPSPRMSDRVPFGTGAAITKWIENNSILYFTYNFKSFIELKKLFAHLEQVFILKNSYTAFLTDKLSEALINFLTENSFDQNIEELKANSSNYNSFRKRFFNWFNAFKCLKSLNYLSQSVPHIPIAESSYNLIQVLGYSYSKTDAKSLLLKYRELEKNTIS